MPIDSQLINVDDSIFRLDTVPVIIQNRTYVPIRFIIEQFGYSVEWNGEERIVTITKVDGGNTGWSEPTASIGPHGYEYNLGLEHPAFFSSSEILKDDAIHLVSGDSIGIKNLHDEKNITIDTPIRIAYEIYKVGADGSEELMTKFVFNSFTGELPPYTITFLKIPYSGWIVTADQYRISITADASFVYYLGDESLSNTLNEISRYHKVENMISITSDSQSNIVKGS